MMTILVGSNVFTPFARDEEAEVTKPNLNAVNSNLDNDDQTSAGKGDVEA